MDIINGDFLVVGSDEYPIKVVADWAHTMMNSISFQKLATVSASTKRSPAETTDGFVGAVATNLTGLSITPLDPLTPEIQQSYGLDTAYEALQTFISDGSGFVEVIVQDTKR